MMRCVVNPAYRQFEDFIQQIAQIFEDEGRTIYKARNEIKVFKVNGLVLNVKRYRVPLIFNRIIYSFFRWPKARRAYEYALRLLDKGFDTPVPIAYQLIYTGGLLGYSYFISLQLPSSYNTMYEVGKHPARENADLFQAFGVYVGRLHEAGVYHADLSPGNILYYCKGKDIHFSLVDINRMRFVSVPLRKGCANFARLWGREEAFRIMAKAYAETRHFDVTECCRWVLYYRNRFWKKYALRHTVEFEL